ncbi:alkaline phosphatase family protein [bacterium]|nr:alkaline phosphatase family protein [bacterium]
MRNVIIFLLSFIPSFILIGDTAKPPNAAPRLILVLAVDQCRYDYLTRFAPLFEGGFRWLLKNGAVFSNANYGLASNETGPGHSVLLTGRHGSHSGIVANEWYDSFLKTYVNVVDDPTHQAVGSNGRSASPTNLIGYTVGDYLKKQSTNSHVVTVSLKDRAAVLLGGHRADAAYWYDTKTGNFGSSTYYMDHLPAWLNKFNSLRFADRYAGKSWERLKSDVSLYEKYAGPDAIEGEWDRKDIVFPHVLRGTPPSDEYYGEFRRVPFADEMTLQVALEALKAHDLGTDDAPDVFGISFSATDVIGHTYGPDSQELMDQILRLDQYLQKLFDAIDKHVGLANTIVILSADHGVMPLVEVLQSRGINAKRVNPSVLEQPVIDALKTQFSNADGLYEFSQPSFYLKKEEIKKRGLKQKDVEDVIVKALRGSDLVEAVYTQEDLIGEGHSNDPYFTLVQNSFFAPRSPDITVVLKKYIYMGTYVGGTGHGTVYDYDRHIPLVFAGPGIKAGTYDQSCGPEDIAPTLATLLKLTMPKEDDARVLSEALIGKQ